MKPILITGGTGALGRALVSNLLDLRAVGRIRVYSRDEHKQAAMARDIQDERIDYFLGDVRDANRLGMAMRGVGIVIHCAALKVVPALEYNPTEGVKTNVLGAMNIAECAIREPSVEKVVAISSDKACGPLNLYGATKLCAEKIMTAANAYGGMTTKFATVRYGNVTGSTGSVVPLWLECVKAGKPILITDPSMSRFWYTLPEAVRLVMTALDLMTHDGEVFVPKIPSYRVGDLAEAVAPGHPTKTIGIRAGEKMHEAMVAEDEPRWDDGDVITITGQQRLNSLPEFGWSYRSDTNDEWLGVDELRKRLKDLGLI